MVNGAVIYLVLMVSIACIMIATITYDFRPYVSFTGCAFYIAVRCGFDKHLFLTSCLNAHNTCIRLPQTGCTARTMTLLIIISQDRQTQVHAANAMATTIIID